MNQDLLIGTILAVVSGWCMVILLAWVTYRCIQRIKTPKYVRKIPKAMYAEQDMSLLMDSYEAAGSIEGMLTLGISKCTNKKMKKRLAAAESYLKESRYKDYETALYFYAADGTKDSEQLFRDIIEREVIKRRGLPIFQEVGL